MPQLARSRAAASMALGVWAAAALAQPPTFVDRAAEAGLELVTFSGGVDKNHILESTGNGVLALDYDGDGDQDLYFVNAFRLEELGKPVEFPSALYRNEGGGLFLDVSARAGVAAAVYGHGGCVGDYDRDGLPDIYVTVFGSNILYRNRGDGTFEDVTAAAGVGDPGWGIGASFLDADRDGDHDLFVGNYIDATWEEILAARRTRRWRDKVYVMDGPRGLPEAANVFYVNNGDGTFSDATERSGLADGGLGYTMGVAAFDFDRDGAMDLYLANDSTPNRLYRSRGDGTFEEVGTWTGSAYNAHGRMQGSMGVGTGDYDEDGWLDIAVTNFAHDYYTIYRNLDGEFFQDDSFSAGLATPSFRPLGWAAVFFDADLDGDLDLFFSNGHIYPQVDDDPDLHESYRQTNQLLVNDGGVFRDVSAEAGPGFAIRESSRGASVFDVDNDGDLDIAVSNQDARPNLLVNGGISSRHWSAVDLRSSRGLPLGATVEVRAGGSKRFREISSGGSYASQNDLRLHVGLGAATGVDSVLVTWPDGARQEILGPPVDRYLVIERREAPAP